MSNKATEAAKAIRNEINRLRGLQAAVDYLEDLGGIENAIQAATERERTVAEELELRRDNTQKELDDLIERIQRESLSSKTAITDAKEKARKIISSADEKAERLVTKATEKSQHIVDSAESKSTEVQYALNKYLEEAEVYKQEIAKEVLALTESKNELTGETVSLESRLAKVKGQITKLMSD